MTRHGAGTWGGGGAVRRDRSPPPGGSRNSNVFTSDSQVEDGKQEITSFFPNRFARRGAIVSVLGSFQH